MIIGQISLPGGVGSTLLIRGKAIAQENKLIRLFLLYLSDLFCVG